MGGRKRLKALAEQFGAQEEYHTLCKRAELGDRYRKELEGDVVRLCLALELGAEEPVLRNLCAAAAAEDLLALRRALDARLEEMFPVVTQLGGMAAEETLESGFLI